MPTRDEAILYERLVQVIDSGNLATLTTLIKTQSESRRREDVLADALAVCCEKGNHEFTLHLLTQEGAAPDLPSRIPQSKDWYPPLTLAVRHFHEFDSKDGHSAGPHSQDAQGSASHVSERKRLILTLLQNKSSLIARDFDEQNVLFHVKSDEIAEILLAAQPGSEVKEALAQKERHGNDALMWAIVQGCDSAVSLNFIKRGANIRTVDNEQRTTLMNACRRDRIELVKLLLIQDKSIAGMKDRRGRNIWHHVAMDAKHDWDRELINLLLTIEDDDAGVNETDDQGRTPLHMSSIFGSITIAKAILEGKGAIVDAFETNENKTALHLAAAYGRSDMIQLLIAHDAERTALCNGNLMPLHLACGCETHSVEAVRTLLGNEAEIQLNARTEDNMTPLHIAAAHGHIGIVMALLETPRFTDINAPSQGGWTALHLACGRQALDRSFSDPTRADAQEQNYLAVAQALLLAGSEVNQKSQTSRTALHIAAELGHVEILKLLLAQRDVHFAAKDSYGNTPLFYAARSDQRSETVPLLAPWTAQSIEALPKDVKQSARDFDANVVDFGYLPGARPRRLKIPVFDLLYKPVLKPGDISKSHVSTRPDVGKGGFRWIHLPANNLHWCHTLLTKHFIECGFADVDNFEHLERSLSQQEYRGRKMHSNYMRPMCMGPPQPEAPLRDTDSTPSDSFTAFLFLPYLTLESRQSIRTMHDQLSSRSSKLADDPVGLTGCPIIPEHSTGRDARLHKAYSNWRANEHSLHIRRTLDQFFYRNTDTRQRDDDQVVSRYQEKENTDSQPPNESRGNIELLMVDQLWVWILGPELIVTSFPQRWQQPRSELPDLLSSLLEELDTQTGTPVPSIFALTTRLVMQCMSTADRASHRSRRTSVLEMFSSNVGDAMFEEVKLFSRFRLASATASHWVKCLMGNLDDRKRQIRDLDTTYQQARNRTEQQPVYPQSTNIEDRIRIDEPSFVEDLLSIYDETRLLEEVKDIQDELGLLSQVLEDQQLVHKEILGTFGPALMLGPNSTDQQKLQSILREQHLSLQQRDSEIKGMEQQVHTVYRSLTDLLDHKQKHSNAIEARYGSGYARSQAAETAKVGRTLMIFTVVTIIFLPMSFLAAFFAINIKELPHVDNEQQMSLSFVMQNVVGVGLGTALAFVLIAWHHHRALDWLRRLPKQMRTLAEIVASMSSRESRQEIPKGIKKPTTTNHGVHG